MICRTCNASNGETARFCSDCGAEMPSYFDSSPPPLTQDEITRLRSAGNETGQVVTSAASQSRLDEGVTRAPDRKGNHESTVVDGRRGALLGSTIAGKYRLDAKVGEGGMGSVFRATRLLIGDEVAVKILHSEQRDPTTPERFRREAQAAARLKHPNAVNIYDFGITDDGLQYLVMELVEGESLRRIIQQKGPLTPSAAAEIMNQVCAALDEAHRHHVLHRDLKPDNIIVNVTDAGLRVKVLDFGIAKLRDDVAGNLTQTGSILGTPHYMSPEQCIGEELDSRSDIYSLGVVLYEMLTGVVPFRSPSSAAVVVQHVNQPPPSPRALNPSITMPVESAVLHALQKSRDGRPQSAGALAQELTAAVKNPSLAVPAAAFGSIGQEPTLLVDRQLRTTGAGESRRVGGDVLGSHARSQTTRIVGLTVLGTLLLLGLGGLSVRLLFGTKSDPVSGASNNSGALIEPSPSARQTARLPDAPAQRPTVSTYPEVPLLDTSLLTREVRGTLEDWAGATRAHDLDSQMTYYADTVDPYFKRRNVSAAEVRANRSVAFTRYYKLDVQLSNINVVLDPSGTQATTTFDKTFAFEGEKYFSGSVKSELWLTKVGSRWLITGERDIKVYYINK